MKYPHAGSLFLALCSLAAPCRAQNVRSSNFEIPDIPDLTTVYPGDTLLGPWNVTRGSVDLVDVNNIWTAGPAYDGTQYIDLDGASPGAFSWSFYITPGLPFSLSFAYANNYHNQTSAWALVRLYGASGDILTQPINHTTSVAGNLDWSVFTYNFTTGNDFLTLEFSSLSPPDRAGGILLDAVSIAQVPEPSSAALLTGGLVLCSTARRRRAA